MDLSVDKALRITNRTFEAHLSEKFENQVFNGRDIQFVQPVEFDGAFQYDGKRIEIDGYVTTLLNSRCARCNEDFAESVRIQFHEFFYNEAISHEADEEEQEYYFSGLVIKLDDAILNSMFLELPSISLCKPDCKGLCNICGTNLNNAMCDCSKINRSNIFAQLLKDQVLNND